MNLHSACRVLVSGATLLAATAMAAPAPAQPQPAASPCLGQPPSAHGAPPPAPQQWHNPCRLVDAEQPENEQENDGEDKSAEVRQRLDDIEMLSRLNPQAADGQPLPWLSTGERGYADGLQWPAQGGPGSWGAAAHPMYQASFPRSTLHQGDAQVEGGIPAVPEPASVALLLAGLAVVAGAAVRQRRRP